MKTKLRLLKLIMTIILTACISGAMAQVGGLANTGDMTVCVNSTQPYGVMPTGGSTYQWSIIAGSGGSGTILSGQATNLVTVNWTGSGTCTLQVIETNAACTGLPVNMQVTVLPALIPGIAGADQAIAYNSTPLPISATEPSGGTGMLTYQWETSFDGGTTWVIIPGATGLTYAPGALIQTTLYRLVQSAEGSCAPATTNNVTISVNNQLVAGIASADQTICYNSIPAPLTSTAPTGGDGNYTYQWESSVDGGTTWVFISGATGTDYAPGALSLTTLYHLIQYSGPGNGSVTTNTVLVTVQGQVVTSAIWHN